MTRAQGWTVVAGFLGVCGCACALLLSVRATVVCLPGMAANAQHALLSRVDRLQATLDALPDRVVPPLMKAAQVEIRHGVDLAGGKVDRAIQTTDARLGQALQIIGSRSQEAASAVVGIRTDLAPTLAASASLVTDIQASTDDLYWDVKASVGSATVAARGVAETAEAVGRAAPRMAESTASIGESVGGIAADVKREVDAATARKKWWQKALGPVYTVGRLAAAFL